MNSIESFISTASLADLKKVMSSVSSKINELSNAKSPFDHSVFVDHKDYFITDNDLLNDARIEVNKLSFNQDKLDTVWINQVDEQYIFNGYNTKKPVELMENFPAIRSIMDQLNSSGLTTGDLNSCLISRYPGGYSKLNWHSDDEDQQIKQKSSICSVTLGSTRDIQFRKKLVHRKRKRSTIPVLATYEMMEGSVTIMKPGCQGVLEHRVPSSTEPGKDGVRYALSFRHFICGDEASSCPSELSFSEGDFSPEEPQLELLSPPVLCTSSSAPQHRHPKRNILPNAILLAGDSYLQGLDNIRLQKKKKLNIMNLSGSGFSIEKVKKSLVSFNETSGSSYQVKKLFISVGTNDIKHYSKNGVNYLRAPITDLLKTARSLFPQANIYCQSLLPLPVNQRSFIVDDIMQMNKILFDVCARQKCFYMDVMSQMLNEDFVRNPALFKPGRNIHPNAKGYGVLARMYIRIIHSKRFNPLVY